MDGFSRLDAPLSSGEFFVSAGTAPDFAFRTFWTLPASLRAGGQVNYFVGVRHRTSARRFQSREGSNRRNDGRRKTTGVCAIRSGRLAFLRRIRPPSGSSARVFKPRRNVALSLSASSFNPQSHGAPSLARRRARNPSGRPDFRPGPRRRKRKGDPGQRPRHACKSPSWPTK
jgi:hypothetical protein